MNVTDYDDGQWLQILFEEIFGLHWHGSSNTLVLDPMVPDELAGNGLAETLPGAWCWSE